MGDNTAIEWSDASWNPIVGCSRVSEGCRHCYAERQAYRAEAMGIPQYEGTTMKVGSEIRWTGKVALVESAIELPLKWKTPRRIFVNSMSDLFHESVKDEWIAAIFAVMFMAGHHTYQILTKRPERMRAWLSWFQDQPDKAGLLLEALADLSPQAMDWPMGRAKTGPWPKPHIWLGVSVEDQATADERIPLLLQTPAAVRWVSYEPALGPVDFSTWVHKPFPLRWVPSLDWLVVGGESGPGARPFDLAWARQTIAQGRAAGVPVFCKQMGARPFYRIPERALQGSASAIGRAARWKNGQGTCGSGSIHVPTREKRARALGVPVDQIPDGRGKHGNHARGAKNGRWNEGRMISSEGYVLLRVGKEHQLAFGNGYAYEHLLVWVSAGNEQPGPDELIHHDNEDKTDNRLGNLKKVTRSDHGRHHIGERDRAPAGTLLGDPAEWPEDLRVREYPR